VCAWDPPLHRPATQVVHKHLQPSERLASLLSAIERTNRGPTCWPPPQSRSGAPNLSLDLSPLLAEECEILWLPGKGPSDRLGCLSGEVAHRDRKRAGKWESWCLAISGQPSSENCWADR